MTDYEQVYRNGYDSSARTGRGSVSAGIAAVAAVAERDGRRAGLSRALEIAEAVRIGAAGTRNVALLIEEELAELAGTEVPR